AHSAHVCCIAVAGRGPLLRRVSRLAARRDLHSFPTRRSSDLGLGYGPPATIVARHRWIAARTCSPPVVSKNATRNSLRAAIQRSSEEHTSELQSRRDLVCRLLLERKNLTKGVIDSQLPTLSAA